MDSSKELHRIIERRIERTGPITFAEFMEITLYHPQYGYYASGRSWRGKGGDYFTSPTVHWLFGAMLGKQVAQMWKILSRDDFEIVEMGGGEGYLCYDILDYLKQREPLLYDCVRYISVEVSPRNSEEQRELLGPFAEKVCWCVPDQLKTNGVTGCFLSNELVDSFPVHRVIMQAGKLREIYVTVEDGILKDVFDKPSTTALEEYFGRLGISLVEGQEAEVNLEALRWLRHVAEILETGFVITIDYGYSATELYSPHRKHGTLLCYRNHTVAADPYAYLGRQDITAHVDFTSLVACGEESGLAFAGLVPQYRFLLALGILEELQSLAKRKGELQSTDERLTIKNLILPGGMGDAFKVLIQHKGIAQPELDGLKQLANGGEL